ncbi:MAG: YaaR family protein [Spirochaetes bacterium]|nr:YaaR family protein [Spirochaetota bacterium]
MLRVNQFKSADSARIKSGSGTSSAKKTDASFSAELSNAVSEKNMRDFQDMMDDLHDQEKRFFEKRDLEELANYKALVQKLLTFISDSSFESKELSRLKSTKAPFLITKKINEKLLEISQQISRGNKAFNLLKELDEIRGLILDYTK